MREHPAPDCSPFAPATLLVAGDLCPAGFIGAKLSGPDAGSVFGGLASVLGSVDLSVVNIECPLSDDPDPTTKSGPLLWGPPAAAHGIRVAGFTVASLANNHVRDAGGRGVLHSVAACEAAGLDTVGAGSDYSAATKPLIKRLGDLTVAILAFAENEFSTTTGAQPGAWPFDLVDNARQISQAARDFDYVLVLFHGGAEHYPLPSPRMQKACRFFVDMGADAVVCHHSHVPGGYEIYKDAPIAYGTGNLLFDPSGPAPADWLTGFLVRLHAGRHMTAGMEIIPYRQDPAAPSVSLLTGSDKDSFLSRSSSLNQVIADADLLKKRWMTFCSERRPELLGSLLCLTRPESWLLDRGRLPGARYRLTQKHIARLRNLFSCETHAEACEQMLRDLLDEKTS